VLAFLLLLRLSALIIITGLPVQVRDSQLTGGPQQIPLSEANREYFADQAERQIASGQLDLQAAHSQVHDTLRRLTRPTPYYKRNEAHVCSFFLKGNCTRGATCPYRHEVPENKGDLNQQNIKDRYYGVNDPVARKMLKRASEMPGLAPPEDKNVRTLYLGNVQPYITQQDIKYASSRVLSRAARCMLPWKCAVCLCA
jgi:pre-mRNA-splicing factor RBM22/SLT11